MVQVAEKINKNTHGLNINKIRKDFPMLSKKFNGKKFIYLDSAASSQKPEVVIKRLKDYYENEYGKPDEEHTPSKITTDAKAETRKKVAQLINAKSEQEIVFVKGCTDGINLVANGFGEALLEKNDEILITQFEHHANIVPWQMIAKRKEAVIRVVPITANHELNMDAFIKMISNKTKIISLSHSSHVLGTVLPIKKICAIAHKKGIPVFVDGAQAAPHMPIDVQDLDCDFYTFSGHKMGSPTGVGVLYGKKKWLAKLQPSQGGGDMSVKVDFETTKLAPVPERFEAGTGSFADLIAFGTLIDYVTELDLEKTSEYEVSLMKYAEEKLRAIPEVIVYGEAEEKEPVIAFDLKNRDVKELEKYLNDEWSIAVRAGDLTAHPLMKVLGVKKLLRISFCYYNTYDEIDIFMEALETFIKG